MSPPGLIKTSKWTPGTATLGLLLLSLLLHVLVIGQVDLSVDEAHYALYGTMPDWSYFDHPPLVGWLQALVLPLSESEFALRLWPLLLSAAATLLVYRLSAELFPHSSSWTPFVAVLLLHSMLVFQLLGIAMVPEVPLLVMGLAATLWLWRAMEDNRWRSWLFFGLFLGLAGLSKYTAVTLALGAVLFIVWQAGWRALFNPRLWLAAAVALLLITPVLYWNALNEWVSFRYQLGHGLPDKEWQLQRLLTAMAGQVLAYGPALMVFSLAAAAGRWGQFSAGGRLLLCMALPLLLLIAWGAGFETTLPHWTLLGWALLAPLAAAWLSERKDSRWVRRVAWVGGGYSAIMVVVLHALLLGQWIPFEPYRHPLTDLHGWREAADRAVRLQREAGASATLYVGNWVMASRIAWYARPNAVKVADRRYDQFDIWYGAPAADDRALLIVPEYLEGRDELNGLGSFQTCNRREQFVYAIGNTPVNRFSYYICTGYHG